MERLPQGLLATRVAHKLPEYLSNPVARTFEVGDEKDQSGDGIASYVSLEALQEVKVQTSGLSAEYGRTQSGIFNFVMKSGTNQIHGSAFGALRNEVFNANTFANKAGDAQSLETKLQALIGQGMRS